MQDTMTPKVYLMRWNPSFSSFTLDDYKKCVEKLTYGLFPMNWSIREWEEARKGDFFYMLRVGDVACHLWCSFQRAIIF